MASTPKPKALVDQNMARQSMKRAADAVTKNYKTFSMTIPGGLHDGKNTKNKKGLVDTLKKTIEALKDPKKKLEFVTVRLTIRDSSTIFNYADASSRYEQIKQELRNWLTDSVSLHANIKHEKSYEFCVYVEGEISEKEIWE